MGGPPLAPDHGTVMAGLATMGLTAYGHVPLVGAGAGRAMAAMLANAPTASQPVISGIVISEVTSTSFRVTWDVSMVAQGWIEYGTTAGGPYGSETEHEESFAYSHHSQVVSGLTAGTTYRFRIVAVNQAGQTVRSDEQSQATSAGSSPDVGSFYGIWNPMNGVGNQRLIQDQGVGTVTVASYRFRAKRTGYIRSVRWSNTTGGGYSGGSPTARISLQSDSGATHIPSGTILSQCPTFVPASSDNAGTLSTFSTPYQVTAGQLYHIVFENLSSDTSANNYSINCIVMQNGRPSPRWGSGALDFGALLFNNGAWLTEGGIAQRPGYFPIMELTYSDTAGGAIVDRQGQGFVTIEQTVDLITGNTQVRERIVVSGAAKTVTGVLVFCERVDTTGTGSLTVSLDDSGGTSLATATFPYTDFVSGSGVRNTNPIPVPAERLLSVVRTLNPGSTYYVRLSAPSGTTYMMEPVTKGVGWGYDPSVCFSDGTRQKTTGGAGGSWTTFTNTDVQVMLRLGS